LTGSGGVVGRTAIGFWTLAALAAALGPANAFQAAEAPEKWIRFDKVEGLPSNEVNCIYQDREGFLWFGTQGGLARYDGYHFKGYRRVLGDETSLSENRVLAIVEDRAGRLWIGTAGGGLNLLDRQRRRFLRFPSAEEAPGGLRGSMVSGLMLDDKGWLWIASQDGGVSRVNPEEPEQGFIAVTLEDQGETYETAYELIQDDTGVVWVAVDGGVFELDAKDGSVLGVHRADRQDDRALSNPHVYGLLKDRDNAIWIATANGLNRFGPERERFERFFFDGSVTKSRQFGEHFFSDLAQDGDGRIWTASYQGGVRVRNPQTGAWRQYTHRRADKFSLDNNLVASIFADRSGVIWIGYGYSGLGKVNLAGLSFDNRPFLDYGPEDAQPTVLSMTRDGNGHLWVGTDQGLMLFDSKLRRVALFRHDAGDAGSLGNDTVWALFVDRQNALWVVTDSPAIQKLIWDGRRPEDVRFVSFLQEDPEQSLHGMAVTCVTADDDGQFWVGTRQGLHRWEPAINRSRACVIPFEGGATSSVSTITQIFTDASGWFWVATMNSGLIRMNPGDPYSSKWYRHQQENANSLSHDGIVSLHQDLYGHVWVGSRYGLDRFLGEAEGFERFGERDGLPGNTVQAILSDDQGRLWLSFENGLALFWPQSGKVRFYNGSDGLFSELFGPAAVQGSGGQLVFGCTGGLLAFFPGQINPHHDPPRPTISSVKLYSQGIGVGRPTEWPILPGEALTLGHNQSVFSVEMAALDFSAPQRTRYRFRLRGLDDAWAEVGAGQRTATFAGLEPGGYTFEFLARRPGSEWSAETASLKIDIAPPWWRTPWAYGFYLFMMAALVVGYLRRHRHKLEMQQRLNEELDRKVAERTRDLRENQEKLTGQAATLKAQAKRLQEMDELKTRFFTNVSHEFRTPLTLTLGSLEDALTDVSLASETRRRLEAAIRNARQLNALADELLDLAKLDAGQMPLRAAKTDLTAFLRGRVRAFQPWAERKGVNLIFQADCELLEAWFDHAKMEQIFSNLATNALKHTPAQGKVLVRVSREEGRACFSVKDTGAGIPADELPQVFDRFYQARGQESGRIKGAGIGLSLAQELAKLHGGDIQVSSELGFGSDFRVSFPLGKERLRPEQIVETVLPAEAPLSATAPFAEETVGIGPNPAGPLDDPDAPAVLVVEDHPEVRAYLSEHLGSQYRLLTAENGREGLVLAREHIPDLVVSDVMMPEMDGFELCEQLKNDDKTCHVPVVLLTAKASEESAIAGLNIGADDYLVKPFSVDALLSRIANLIENRRLLRRRFARSMQIDPTQTETPSADQLFMNKAAKIVERHIGDVDFGVQELADEVGFSRRQLHRKVRALTDQTPADLIRRIRLARAAQMLNNRAGNVSEIAYAVGFSKPRHFSTVFKESYGMTPSEYAGAKKRRGRRGRSRPSPGIAGQ